MYNELFTEWEKKQFKSEGLEATAGLVSLWYIH